MCAVRNCIVLARLLPQVVEEAQPGDPYRLGHLVLCQVVPVLYALASDRDWQVRLLVANNCTELCLALGYQRTDVLVDLFLGLLRDKHIEVKTGTVLCLSGLGECLITLAALEVRSLEQSESKEKKREFEQLMKTEAQKQIRKNAAQEQERQEGLGFDPEGGEEEEVKESEEEILRNGDGDGTPPSSPAVAGRKALGSDGLGSPAGTPPGTPPDLEPQEPVDDLATPLAPRSGGNTEAMELEAMAAGRAKIVQSVIPAMFSLASDPMNQTQVVMSALISPVMTMLQLLGRNHHGSMVPLLTKLLDNEFASVSESAD
jgi:hypothetical protein